LSAALLMAGCGQFFPKETTPPPNTSSNFLYVANNATNDFAGLGITSTGLTNIANSPYALGVQPSALAITPSNSFLYVSSLSGAIYAFSIASSGVATVANNGSAVVSQISPTGLRVDSTGKWLIAVDLTPAVYVFAINSDGTLTQQGSTLPLDPGSPNHVYITPSNSLVYVSLGVGGVDILTFNSGSGVITKTNQILKPKSSLNADQGLASDPKSQYLFVSETGVNAVRVLTITATTGALNEVSGSPFPTGLGPNGVIVDATGSYVYVTNRTDGTVSAFALATTGALTQISGSPFLTGTNPVDIAEDKTHAYIAVACSGGTPDLQVFTISTTTPGALTSFASASTGTDPTNAFAVVTTQ